MSISNLLVPNNLTIYAKNIATDPINGEVLTNHLQGISGTELLIASVGGQDINVNPGRDFYVNTIGNESIFLTVPGSGQINLNANNNPGAQINLAGHTRLYNPAVAPNPFDLTPVDFDYCTSNNLTFNFLSATNSVISNNVTVTAKCKRLGNVVFIRFPNLNFTKGGGAASVISATESLPVYLRPITAQSCILTANETIGGPSLDSGLSTRITVDSSGILTLAKAFGSTPGAPNWTSIAGVIEIINFEMTYFVDF